MPDSKTYSTVNQVIKRLREERASRDRLRLRAREVFDQHPEGMGKNVLFEVLLQEHPEVDPDIASAIVDELRTTGVASDRDGFMTHRKPAA